MRLVATALALSGLAGAATPVQQDPLAVRTKGSDAAPITVYEMSDFQCPYCKQHVDATFPALQRDYIATGKVRWIFINFPISEIHPNAEIAAEFAMCAAREGKFWPAHDLLFRRQPVWAPLKDAKPYLLGLADSLRLPRARITACLAKGETREEVKGDAEGARTAGANSTPTFYIEGGLLAGAQPVEVWRPILDSIYRAKTGKPQDR